MRPSRKLCKLHRAAMRRLARLKYMIHRAGGVFREDAEARIAFVTIEARNAWANFVRSYYLSCMFCAVTIGGNRLSPGTSGLSENDAIGHAVSHWSPRAQPKADGSWNRRDEPPWHDHNQLIQIWRSEGFSNIADIEAAFSTGMRTFSDLPVFRNFFAHRSRGTEEAARNLAPRYGIARTKRPSDILLSRPLGRPQPLILEWMDQISFTIDFLCR